MAFETVQYAAPLRKLGNLKDLIFFVLAPLAVGWVIRGFWSGFLLMAVSMCGVYLRWIYVSARDGSASFERAKAHMVAQGCQVDFEGSPWFIVDATNRKIALVNPNEGCYDLYDLSDIMKWEHNWENLATPTRSLLTGQVSDVISRDNNKFVIRTKNPRSPRYEFAIISYDVGQLWSARLDALINGN